MMARLLKTTLLLLGAAHLSLFHASAQSLLGYRGLGVPAGALDGRSAALGNVGVGLAGLELSATDLAGAATLLFPTVTVSMQPVWGEYALGEVSGGSAATRFPLVAIGYPVLSARGAVFFSLSGHMEQSWVSEVPRSTTLGGEPLNLVDRFESRGGSSVARLGWAQRLGGRIRAGVALGTYLGRLDHEFDRTLDSLGLGSGIESFRESGSWDYRGYNAAASIALDPHPLIHAAATVEWSGRLESAPLEGTSGESSYFDLPARYLAGVSGMLTPRLGLNLSAAFQDWRGAAGFPQDALSEARASYGAGIEWTAIDGASRSLPVRIGYRSSALPFRFAGADGRETAWTMGLGFNLAQLNGVRAGWMDLALERGSRASAPLSERFWRATVSLGISRF